MCDDLQRPRSEYIGYDRASKSDSGFDVLTINRRIDLKDRMMDTTSQTSVEARRSFLKKAAYVAPAVVALGALSAPVSAHASVVFNQTYVFNEDNQRAYVSEHYDNVEKYTLDGTFKPDGEESTLYTRNDIVTAEDNYLQKFFDWVFGRS